MVTLVPTMVLTNVDFPTLGRPTTAANPDRKAVTRPRPPGRRADRGTILHPLDASPVDPVGHQPHPVHRHRLPGDRDVAEQVEDQSPDGVPGPGGQIGMDQLVDLVDGQPGADPQLARAQPLVGRLLDVELVDDLPHQLLDEILERDQPGGAAVLVDHHGLVEALGLHLAHQVGDPLGLGHEVGLAGDGTSPGRHPGRSARCGSCPWCRRSRRRHRPGARRPARG